jgi:23S rRNA-intervening sequence protein
MGPLRNIRPGTSLAIPNRMHAESSFRNLKVWQFAMTLVEDVYHVTSTFPVQERFGLTSQLRRAAASVPSNIGEGKRRKREKAFANHLEIAKRVGFLKEADYKRLQRQTEEVGRMLNGLLNSIQDQLDY